MCLSSCGNVDTFLPQAKNGLPWPAGRVITQVHIQKSCKESNRIPSNTKDVKQGNFTPTMYKTKIINT